MEIQTLRLAHFQEQKNHSYDTWYVLDTDKAHGQHSAYFKHEKHKVVDN